MSQTGAAPTLRRPAPAPLSPEGNAAARARTRSFGFALEFTTQRLVMTSSLGASARTRFLPSRLQSGRWGWRAPRPDCPTSGCGFSAGWAEPAGSRAGTWAGLARALPLPRPALSEVGAGAWLRPGRGSAFLASGSQYWGQAAAAGPGVRAGAGCARYPPSRCPMPARARAALCCPARVGGAVRGPAAAWREPRGPGAAA